MKKTLIAAVIALLSVASVHAAQIVKTGTATIATNLSNWTNIDIGQFDTALGTLTGVKVTLKYAKLAGVFTENPSAENAQVSALSTTFYLKTASATSTTGFSAHSYTLDTNLGDTIVTNPDWNVTALSNGVATGFTIDAGTTFASNVDSSIGSGYWAAYEGSGNVVFDSKVTFGATVTAGTVTQDVSGVNAPVEVDITYNYTPVDVPEPATWALVLGGVSALAIGQHIRRRTV